jgi:hypothetical protein
MTNGGKRHSRKKSHTAKHVQTIPELRRAFEYIESVGEKVCKQPMSEAVPEFQKEWKRTFYRELDSNAAEAYLHHLKSRTKPTHKRKTKKLRGGAPLAGAPLDYTTRPGVYIQPGGLNENSYALVPKYVDSGFWNPMPSQQLDPVPGQTRYATATPAGLGSNAWPGAFGVKGGARRSAKKLRGGWAPISQAFSLSSLNQAMTRPFPSDVPPTLGQDLQTAIRGQQLGQSPDPTQTKLDYQMSSHAKPVSNLAVSPINVKLMNDIQ